MQKLFRISTFYMILGLIAGIFYREFTKLNNYVGQTTLSTLHTHIFVLGFLFFILVLLLENNFKLSQSKYFKSWIVSYNVGFMYLVFTLGYRGVLQVLGSDFAGLSHIAGLGHAILGISIIWFTFIVSNALKAIDSKQGING